MFLSNLPVVLRMFTDPRNLRFTGEVIRRLKRDPSFCFAGYVRMFAGSARGERIVRFGNQYIISSYVPPVPSRAFLTLLAGARDKPFTDLAYVRRSAPLSTYLSMTDRCTYNCVHCSAKLRKKGPELTTSQWIKVIADLQDLGTSYIGFTGGEPLLRSDIEEIISSADDRSTTILFTNGKGLSLKRAQSLKKSGLFALSVSLDSADAEVNNRMRNDPDAFASALAAIRSARLAGLYTMVQAVVFRSELSREKLFALFRLVKAHGAHEIRIHQPVPSGRLLFLKDRGDTFYSEEDRKRLFKIQFAANRRLWGFPKVSSFPYTEGPDKFGCSAGLLHSYVTASGELCPCDFIPLSFGNVLKDNLKELYDRMSRAAGIPKPSCLAMEIAPHLRGKKLPLSPEESTGLCRSGQSREYPRFFRDLQ